MNTVRINQGRAFSLYVRIGAAIITMFLIAVFFKYLPELIAILLAILTSMGVPFFLSSFEILEINQKKKLISHYVYVLGKRFQEQSVSYRNIDKIFINQVKMSQKMTSMGGNVHSARSMEYHAFLKTDDDRKHFLISDKRQDSILERLNPIKAKLNVNVVENY
ncbi:MAG: hypothetical protein JXR03_07615 [Cyclobacteriaceae bacterium]